MSQDVYTFIVRPEDLILDGVDQCESHQNKSKCRLDRFLMAREAIACSRSRVRRLIVDGDVTVNGQHVKAGYWVKDSDTIIVKFPEPRTLSLNAEQIPLDILFEDEHLIVLNKTAGMVVHPAPGHYTGTLVHALLSHCQDLSGIGGVQRPGIVHRLDRDTSGLMMVAKTDEAHYSLSGQLKSRQLTRIYATVVHGRVKTLSGKIEVPLGRHRKDRKKMAVDKEHGRYALSLYQVIRQYAEHALLHVELKTGRTHQIRVHMKYIHHPVVGDPLYGNVSKNNFKMLRQALHARTLSFIHPLTQKRMTFETAFPEDMQQLLSKLHVMHSM